MTVSELKGLEETRFTPVQRAIMDVLSDGKPHTKEELKSCLWDDMGVSKTVIIHISNIRKIIRPLGYIITIQVYRRTCSYILSRSISPAE